MQPMEYPTLGVISLMFMGILLQRGDVTGVTVAADGIARSDGLMGKFFHRVLLYIWSDTHLQILRITMVIQRQGYKSFCLFRTAAPLTTHFWPYKVSIIKFYDTREKMCCVPLPHGGADAPKHGPCSFVGDTNLSGQLDSRDSPFIL